MIADELCHGQQSCSPKVPQSQKFSTKISRLHKRRRQA
jgi:hypothetical protein